LGGQKEVLEQKISIEKDFMSDEKLTADIKRIGSNISMEMVD
jgi:hypothetical protein